MKKYLLVGCLLVTRCFCAADGSLDLSFGNNGRVVTAPSANSFANAIAVQPDKKLVVAGVVNARFGLVRFMLNGTVDLSFGNGLVTTVFPGSADQSAAGVGVQKDGKIVAAGYASIGGNLRFALARYNHDGSLDTSFGAGGTVLTTLGGTSERANGLVIQQDGKIVVVGVTNAPGSSDFALIRYNIDGTLDTTFGGGLGYVITGFPGAASDFATALVTPDGKILAIGVTDQPGTNVFALARFLNDGTLDTSFGGTGKVTTSFGGTDDVANAGVLQPDGKVIVAGYSDSGPLGTYVFALARYNNDGSLDTSFGDNGKVTTVFGTEDSAFALTLQPDGKPVAVGYSDAGAGGAFVFALARYHEDGSLDTSFGSTGKITTSFGGTDDESFAALVQSDGKIVVAGTTDNPAPRNFALARYLIPSVEVSSLAEDLRAKYVLFK